MPDEQIQFWKEKLSENSYLEEMLNNILFITGKYNENKETKMDDDLFDKMIEKTVKQKSFRKRISHFLYKIKSNRQNIVKEKFVFGLTLIIILFVFLIVNSEKNNLIKRTSFRYNKDLVWDAKEIDNRISKINSIIMFTQNDKYEKYYLYKISSDQWKRRTITLSNKISKIKKEVESNKF